MKNARKFRWLHQGFFGRFAFHVLGTLLCLSLTSCAQKKNSDFLTTIVSRDAFDYLKGEPLSKNYNGIECVKLIYALKTKTIYYIQSKKYKWHHDFVTRVLNDHNDLNTFNQLNYYDTPQRQYILATLNYNVKSKNYFLQFAPPDQLNLKLIRTLYEKVKSTFSLQANFKVLINTTSLQNIKQQIATEFPVISGDELFENQNFQIVCKGITRGELVLLDGDKSIPKKDFSNKIILLKGNANDLPLCAGLICDNFQTPLSHIALLTRNRGTPCVGKLRATEDLDITKWLGKRVKLVVEANGFKLLEDDGKTEPGKNRKPVTLKIDSLTCHVSPIQNVKWKDAAAYGSKVCHLSELYRIKSNDSLLLPEPAYAIAIGYYFQHIKRAKIQSLILNLPYLPDSLANKQLKKIRTAIKQTPLSPELLTLLKHHLIKAKPETTKWRFRSSSNAEDLDRFNGAGLYDSESGSFTDTAKSVEKAIKKVWASLWSYRAYTERKYFNINNAQVGMGILVHPAIDNELVNGVVITKNLYREGYVTGFVVNVQKGETSVVSPEKGVRAEQFVTYIDKDYDLYLDNNAVDWLSLSSLNPNSSLLTLEEIKQLSTSLKRIKQHFYDKQMSSSLIAFKDYALDIEFKIIKNARNQRRIYIKQVRPFYGN